MISALAGTQTNAINTGHETKHAAAVQNWLEGKNERTCVTFHHLFHKFFVKRWLPAVRE